MAAPDAQRWNDRYASHDAVVISAPPDALIAADLVDTVPGRGRALDVACGLGAQSIWLAQRGLAVLAVDVSSEAIGRLDEATEQAGVASRIDATVFDLDDGLPVGPFDVIVCQRFRDVELYDSFIDRLSVGGLLVLTVLSSVGADQPGEFHAPPGELTNTFTRDDVAILWESESAGQASLVARLMHRGYPE